MSGETQPTPHPDPWERITSKLTTPNADCLPRGSVEPPELDRGWHLLIVPEEDPPIYFCFSSQEALRRTLVKWVGQEVTIFIFQGVRLLTTEPPFPTLVTESGALLPLYPVTQTLVYNVDGRMLRPEEEAREAEDSPEKAETGFADEDDYEWEPGGEESGEDEDW